MSVSVASFRSFKRSDKTDILESGIQDGKSTWKVLRDHLKDIASGSVTDYYRLYLVGKWIGTTFDARSQAHIEAFCEQDQVHVGDLARSPREIKRNLEIYREFLSGLRSGGVERDQDISKLSRKSGGISKLNKQRSTNLGIEIGV